MLRDRVIPTVHLRALLGVGAGELPARRPGSGAGGGRPPVGAGGGRAGGTAGSGGGAVRRADAGRRRSFSGATILADGAPALILDAAALSSRESRMEDVRDLKELQLDALREVANIGAGHAATALSQMTNRKIMISVPEVNVHAARGGARGARRCRRGGGRRAHAHDGRPHRPHAAALPGAVGPRPLRHTAAAPDGHHHGIRARWSSRASRRSATS